MDWAGLTLVSGKTLSFSISSSHVPLFLENTPTFRLCVVIPLRDPEAADNQNYFEL